MSTKEKVIFKQGILKEEKNRWISGFAIILVLPIILLVSVIIRQEFDKYFMFFVLVVLGPQFFLIAVSCATSMEWFCIYEDRIEVRNLFRVKNVVYYDRVKFVEEVTINLTSRGMEKQFYIFNDGRKNNNSLLDLNSCYNRKKYNLRIYKTPELEDYILNTLYLELKCKK